MHANIRHALALLAAGAFVAAPLAAASADHEGDFPGFEEKVGTATSDQLRGTAANDYLRGLDGADVVQGYRGMDILRGGDGWDNASGGLRSDDVSGGPGRDVVTGGDAADWVIELGGDDLVNGGAGRDWMGLGTGSDTLQAGDNGDLVLVLADRDPDTIQCGEGYDRVIYVTRRMDPRDGFRGCEKVTTSRDFEGRVPRIPPVLIAEWDSVEVTEPEETQPEPAKHDRAFAQMAQRLRASVG